MSKLSIKISAGVQCQWKKKYWNLLYSILPFVSSFTLPLLWEYTDGARTFFFFFCLTNQLLGWIKIFFSEIDKDRTNLVTEILFYSCFFSLPILLIKNDFDTRGNEYIPAALLILNYILNNNSSEARRAYNSC